MTWMAKSLSKTYQASSCSTLRFQKVKHKAFCILFSFRLSFITKLKTKNNRLKQTNIQARMPWSEMALKLLWNKVILKLFSRAVEDNWGQWFKVWAIEAKKTALNLRNVRQSSLWQTQTDFFISLLALKFESEGWPFDRAEYNVLTENSWFRYSYIQIGLNWRKYRAVLYSFSCNRDQWI